MTQRLLLTTAHVASVEVGQGRRRRDSERTDDIFAFDIWRMESRTGQKGGSERGRVYCLLFSRERFYDRVSSLLYIRVKVEFRILVYLGHSLGVAGRDRSVSLLFRPFHSVVEQRQHGLFHLLNFILSYFIFFISIKIISGSCDKKERIFLSIGVFESPWDRSM